MATLKFYAERDPSAVPPENVGDAFGGVFVRKRAVSAEDILAASTDHFVVVFGRRVRSSEDAATTIRAA